MLHTEQWQTEQQNKQHTDLETHQVSEQLIFRLHQIQTNYICINKDSTDGYNADNYPLTVLKMQHTFF